MLGMVVAATALVVMVKAGDVVTPAASVTLAGGAAAGSELPSDTTAPPAGAGPFKTTVLPVVELPPATVEGERFTAETDSGFTVKVEFTVVPLYVTEKVTTVDVVTVLVVMVNAGEVVAPAATVTEGGGVAAGSELPSVTIAPPTGAAPFKVTVLFATDVPPKTVLADRLTVLGTRGSTVRVVVLVTPP